MNKVSLKTLFVRVQWCGSSYSSSWESREVEHIILNSRFWNNINDIYGSGAKFDVEKKAMMEEVYDLRIYNTY